MLSDLDPQLRTVDELDSRIRCAAVSKQAWCAKHGSHCQVPEATLNISGSSRRPWSRSNKGARRGRQHEDNKVFRAWAQSMLCDRPKITLHENVIGFDPTVLTEALGDMYELVGTIKRRPHRLASDLFDGIAVTTSCGCALPLCRCLPCILCIRHWNHG